MSIKFNGKEISRIVLDFDGTFYSSNKEFEAKIWGEVRRKLVEKLFETEEITSFSENDFKEKFESFIERSRKIGWGSAFVEMGGSQTDFKEIISTVNAAEHLEFDAELVKLLNDLMEHVPVHIFTGSKRQKVFNALEVLIGEMKHRFENGGILASDDIENGHKPDESAYLEMMEKFGIRDPELTVFVDDQRVEVDTASSLGFITFLIKDGCSGEESIGPHVVLNSIHELAKYLLPLKCL